MICAMAQTVPAPNAGWAANSGNQIDTGWAGFVHVLSGGDGVIYAIRDSGELLWYRDDLRDGTNGPGAERGWAANSGNQIGTGWAGFVHVLSGGDGVIYAIRDSGELLWYRDDLRDGTNGPGAERGWAANSGNQIGTGWAGFVHVLSGGDGVIYAIRDSGELLWYRDDLRDGTNGPGAERGWAANSGNQIGTGWTFAAVLNQGSDPGSLYAISDTTDMLWYRDDLRDGTNGPGAERGWAANSGNQIGIGWNTQPERRLDGYAVPLSAAPGETVELKISSLPRGSATMQVCRLVEHDDGSVGDPVGISTTIEIVEQPVPTFAWQDGCGWSTTTTVHIDPVWRSGLYAARVMMDGGATTEIVFVVRPAPPAHRNPLLVLANTNCWNAYNAWGGRSNYTVANTGITLSFERPNPETQPDARAGDGWASNHLTAAEIWLMSWLEGQGFSYDVCSDYDLHEGLVDLSDYRCLVLSTHPEYWSRVMAFRVEEFLDGGGHLLYLGGNGIFRNVEFLADGSAMTTGADAAHMCVEAWSPDGPFPRTLLGVAYDLSADSNYPNRCGYVVDDASHRFFAGTGLVNGDVFAIAGRNGGGACGWEVDCASAAFFGGSAAPQVAVLAHGQLMTGAGYGGDIAYYDTDGGGFVFAIGSITVTGGLGADARLDTLVKNALSEATTPI